MGEVESMDIDELICQLESIREEHGNIPVFHGSWHNGRYDLRAFDYILDSVMNTQDGGYTAGEFTGGEKVLVL